MERSRERTSSLFVVLLAVAFLPACAGGSDPSRTGESGRATFRLTATSASGNVYRLRGAAIDVQGAQAAEIAGPLDPADPQLTATASLAAGSYQFTLRPGWTMYEVPPGGAPVVVQAQLTGPNPVVVEIAPGQDAPVTFHFLVAGETIPTGTATVGIAVDQADGGLPPEGPPGPEPSTVPVIIPANVRVTDEATRAALVEFGPASGTLRFAHRTPLLDSLVADDVVVSAPSAAAPAGYLRKVVSVRVDGAEVVVETSQANLTDAVEQGVLQGRVELGPDHLLRTEYEMEGVTIEPAPSDAGEELLALGVGESYAFQMNFNHVFVPVSGPGASGRITVNGSIQFNVGYGVHVGISACWEFPFVCVDSFQASVGFSQSAHLSIVGTASGLLGAEVKIATQYYAPKVFFIGPVPVVVVPSLILYLTAGGQVEARVSFEASEAANAQLGARWTDANGWQDISSFGIDADVSPLTFTGVIKPRAAAKTAMSLKLYDIAGPELSLEAGLELDGHVPRNPTWIINGFLVGKLAFRVDLPIIGTLANFETTLFDTSRELKRAPNAPPTLDMSSRTRSDPNVYPPGSPPWVGLRVPVDFTPGCSGILGGGGYFAANDPEDGCVRVTIVSDRDGALPYKHTFTTVGRRTLTITATDSQGAAVSKKFVLNVVNNNPSITLTSATPNPHQGEPVVISAAIADANEADGARLCASNVWTVDAPDTWTGGGCRIVVTFGATGSRQVGVRTQDSDGAEGGSALALEVLPPRPDPVPLFRGAKLYLRDSADRRVEFCPFDQICCVARDVPEATTIDLTKPGCSAPNAYFVDADVANPAGEALIYEWTLQGPRGSVLGTQSSASPRFEMLDDPLGTSLASGDECRVILSVKAPDPSHNIGPFPVWQGRCTYHYFNGIR